MSDKKQTSIDFFGHNMATLHFKVEINNITKEEFYTNLYKVFIEAKQLHKQEIIDAVNQTEFDDIDNYGICETETKGEQYYQETYGG